jgi:SAM-dependent methyltransferase
VAELHERIREWWDADAHVYDGSEGHAMSDPVEAAAWAATLARFLPHPPSDVLDVGAGTGALSLLAADLGHHVTALDLSPGMLGRAGEKARARDVALTLIEGRAESPPAGPFDAVIERHVVWTLPDPVAALAAWLDVVRPGGRLVLLEGSWGGEGPLVAAKDLVSSAVRRVIGGAEHHHGAYPTDVVAALPLSGTRSPAPFIDAVRAAGWRGVRLYRLRDVDWAVERREPWPMGWLERRPRYAVVAERATA